MSTHELRKRLVLHCGIALLVASAMTGTRSALADVVDPFQGGPSEQILFSETDEQAASDSPVPCREEQGKDSTIQLVNSEAPTNAEQSKSDVHTADFQLNAP